MKTEIEIDENLIPEGYEAVTYRLINEGELYCADYGEVVEADHDMIGNLGLILKKKRWRADVEEAYWFTTSFNTETMEMEVRSGIEVGGATDEVLWRFGNYYKTKAEAVEAGVRVHKAYLNE